MNGESANTESGNITDVQTIEAILSLSMKDLADCNKPAYDLLVKRANEGFFEEHQTPKAIKTLAAELIKLAENVEGQNED